MNNQRLQELARKGLEFERENLRKRLAEVDQDLRELGVKVAVRSGNGPVARKTTGRKNWTPEQRAAVAERMRLYWQNKRAGKSAKPAKASKSAKRTAG